MKAVLVTLLCLAFGAGSSLADESNEKTGKSGFGHTDNMGGPASTSAQLEEDDKTKKPAFRFQWFDDFLQPWFDFKGRLNDNYGLKIEAAYTALYQGASDVPEGAEDQSAVGIFRVFGKWTLLGRESDNPGGIVFSADNRHLLGTDIGPGQLGFQGGYLGIPGTLFNDLNNVLVDLNWQQRLAGGRAGFVIGRYDPNDFFDVLGYSNPWKTFQNAAILFNTSIALADVSMGVGFGTYISDKLFVLGTVNDANGIVTDVGFFDDGEEFYSHVELAWTPDRDQRYFQNVHVSAWHVDEREEAGVEESEGFTVGANWTYNMKWMWFVKAGASEGSAPMHNESVTAGFINYLERRSDLWGLGINWGKPSDDELREQLTSELFYRLQFAQNMAITPSVQWVVDPALNPDEDQLWVMGVRTRLTF